MSDGIECDCHFCSLVKMNTQVCAIPVIFPKNNNDCFTANEVVKGDYCPSFKYHICSIAQIAKNKWKLKVGDSDGNDNDEFKYNVLRKSARLYHVCFHAKKKAEAEAEAEPDCDDPAPPPAPAKSNAPSLD
jgi:hypothetical protein